MRTVSFRFVSIVLALLIITGVHSVSAQNKVELTFWYWAESDAPGADKWMADTVEAYKKVQPDVTVTVVAQSTDTLIGGFQSAVTAGSGPDIASQWATGPVLSFVWQDALVPVSDYVPADEMKHWLNLNENSYNGKNWGASMYLIGVDLLYNKDLFKKANVTPPTSGRWTWDEFMAACKQLKAAGITPFVVGDKDGYGGAWWFANIGMQALDSTEELRQAVIGKTPFTSDKYVSMYKPLDDMIKSGYINADATSLTLDQGIRQFWQGQGAMAFGTDGMAKQATSDLGEATVGVMRPPKWGTGKLADAGNATQSISFLITKWSQHPQEAANFLAFLHTPDRLTAWYKATGVVPADDRFDRTLVTSPILKQMTEWETTGPQIWLENYIPAQLDSDADLPAGQTIYAQSGSPADAAALWEQTAQSWRTQHPDELKNWQNWEQK